MTGGAMFPGSPPPPPPHPACMPSNIIKMADRAKLPRLTRTMLSEFTTFEPFDNSLLVITRRNERRPQRYP
jgi:hypothetical protein